jgi:hypothetical protein
MLRHLPAFTLGLGLIGASALVSATPLFRIESELAKSHPTQERTWHVAIDRNIDIAKAPTLELNLPGQAPLRAERTHVETHPGGQSWHGRLHGKAAMFTNVDGRLHGEFQIGLEHYVLSSERGRTVLSQRSRFETRQDVETPAPMRKAATSVAAKAANSPVEIRILIAHTDAVLAAAGSSSDVASAAQFMIDQLNAIFARSVAADIRFSFAGLRRVGYDDGIDSEVALQQISTDTAIAEARDAEGADIVVLLVENTDFAGRAFMPNTVDVGNAGVAFAVVARSYGLNYYTFAHEIGHVMGLDHGGGAVGTGAFPWGQGHVGYVNSAAGYPEGFVTVMANIGLCGGTPPCHYVPYFSNPELTDPEPPVRGRALGETDIADSARALRETAATVAMYRPDVATDELLYANFEDSDTTR